MKTNYNIQSTIFLEKNPKYHSRMKNIDVKHHFIRDMVEIKKVLLEKVDILENILDSLTKFVSSMKFSWCIKSMGIISLGQ
jgi:hypothetical protein